MDDDLEDSLITIRMKYVEDLEDILECPICLSLPSGSILTCIRGHHICEACQKTCNIKVCPVCQNGFNGSRNYVAEGLSAKFDDIKTSLLEPNHYVNRKIVKKCIETQTDAKTTCSVEIQTDFNKVDVEIQTDENEDFEYIDDSNDNNDTNFKIPCLIEACKEWYLNDRIITHIKRSHKKSLKEIIASEDGLFTTTWTLLYKTNKIFDYVINILDMGLYFFKLSINEKGDLYWSIETSSDYVSAQQMYYVLLITNEQNSLLSEVFKGKVTSRQKNGTTNCQNDNFISNSCFSDYLLNKNKIFECSLTLYRPEKL